MFISKRENTDMLTNAEMKSDRFVRWANARAKVAKIKAHLGSGGVVIVSTMTRAVEYKTKHSEMFKATRTGVYVARGKSWDCIDYSNIRFGRYV